ncbi:MAG: hypothetical protein AB7R77_12670 [Ilumatobacteraceae bacterium]
MFSVSVSVHPDRYADEGRKGVKIAGVVVHTTEGSEDDGGVRTYLTMKGDRPTSSGGQYGSSYDAQALSDGTWVRFVLGPDGNGSPYSAPPLNRRFLHIVMPGKVSQFDDATGWRDDFSYGCIRAVASFIVEMSKVYGFPIVKRSPEELAAAGSEKCDGYCGHWDVSRAWPAGGSEGHTDPGPNFPWGLLADEISKLTDPPKPKEDFMWSIIVPVNSEGRECAARFVGPMDARGILGLAIWSGPGARGQQYIDDHKAAGAPERRADVAAFRNVVLASEVPYGDPEHDWTADDFRSVLG